MILSKDFYNYENADKVSSYYLKLNKFFNFKNKIIKPASSVLNPRSCFYSNQFYSDDQISSIFLTKTSNLFITPLTNLQISIDETYENLKFLNYFYYLNNKLFLLSTNNFFYPLSHTLIFDSFRTDERLGHLECLP